MGLILLCAEVVFWVDPIQFIDVPMYCTNTQKALHIFEVTDRNCILC